MTSSDATECIPIDVLCEIFLFLRDISPPTPVRGHRHGWIQQVTHVCKRWREVGLRLANLWADIVCAFTSRTATNTILARARSTPLTFCELEHDTPSTISDFRLQGSVGSLTPYHLSLAAEHALQLRAFVYTADIHDWTHIFDGKTLPQLQTLELSKWNPSSSIVREDIHSMNAPMLYRLTLHRMLFPINAPALRSLELTYVKSDSEIRVETERLLSFLSLTPLLEELRLVYALANVNNEEHFTGREVVLSHLQRMMLADEVGNHILWQSLHAPTEMNIYIELSCVHFITGELSTLLSHITRYLRSPSYDSLIILENHHRIDFHLEGPQHRVPDDKNQSNETSTWGIVLSVNLDDDLPGLSALGVLEKLIPYIQVTNIQHLYISQVDSFKPMDDEGPPPLLMSFFKVESLVVNSRSGNISLLAESAGGDGALILPALHQLVVEDLSFGSCNEWQAVHEILKYRASLGAPISTLVLIGDRGDSLHDNSPQSKASRVIDAEGLQQSVNLVLQKVEDLRE